MRNEHYIRPVKVFLAAALMACLLSACGGGGGGGGASASALAPKTLSWDVPTQYTDGTTYDPATTLKEYEIFVRGDTNFSPADSYVVVTAVDSSSQLVTSFDMRLAYAPLSLSKGVTYYTAMRSVTLDGVRSDFSLPSPSFTFQ